MGFFSCVSPIFYQPWREPGGGATGRSAHGSEGLKKAGQKTANR